MAKKKAASRSNGSAAKKVTKKKKPEPEFKEVEIPLRREFPPNQVGILANNFVIQRDGPECHLLFFQTLPPIVLAEKEEERRKLLEQIEDARSVCVARIIVSGERLPSFIEAMQTNVERHKRHAASIEPAKGAS